MVSHLSSTSDTSAVWIYHERQAAALCGQHALNNLVQCPIFTVSYLSDIAHQLDQMERSVLTEPSELVYQSANVDEAGNFSIQVLKAALQTEFNVALPHLRVVNVAEITNLQGFLCHKSNHWFAIRQIGGRFWNLNSELERPEAISHFALGTQIQELWTNGGYTVFGIEKGLPAGGVKFDLSTGFGRWHLMSDLLKGTSTKEDPWKSLSGAGRILNKLTGGSRETHDDDLRRALLESLQSDSILSNDFYVPDEPLEGTPGAVRIQLRLPNGKRVVRRFNEADSVKTIYAFVNRENCGNKDVATLELRCGFPPKDLCGLLGLTIGQAKLAGESIQGRYL